MVCPNPLSYSKQIYAHCKTVIFTALNPKFALKICFGSESQPRRFGEPSILSQEHAHVKSALFLPETGFSHVVSYHFLVLLGEIESVKIVTTLSF